MGNTILDFHRGLSDLEKDLIGIERMVIYLKEYHEITISFEELKMEFYDKWINDFPLREIDLKELNVKKYLSKVKKLQNIIFSNDEYIGIFKAFYSIYIDNVVTNPGIEETFEFLKSKGFTICILSNTMLFGELYKEVFLNLELDKYIDEYFFSYDTGYRKPHNKAFLNVISHFKNSKCLWMVGDNINSDIVPASGFGMNTILFDKDNKIDRKVATYKIQNFGEIIDIFTRLEGEMNRKWE
jgi:FMN phosphatase YigB (HAD superfamily)